MPGTIVAGEVEGGELSTVTAELISAAVKLNGGPPAVVLATDDAERAGQAALAYGVPRVFALEHPALTDGGTGGYDAPVAGLESFLRSERPDVVLFARTDFGYNVAPRVAARLGVAVAQDCIDLSRDEASGGIIVSRPVYGGNAMAVYRFRDLRPQIAIVRSKAFEPALPTGARGGEITRVGVDIPDVRIRARLVESIAEARQGVRLEEAQVVVAGGRGLGGPEPFEQLFELAGALGGAVGASRAACDAGWIDHAHQIGLTGKSIAPRVYITVGISGASQHMAGCSGAKAIVAINRDPDANIFKEARFGVVGDWQKVLPAFAATVRDLGQGG